MPEKSGRQNTCKSFILKKVLGKEHRKTFNLQVRLCGENKGGFLNTMREFRLRGTSHFLQPQGRESRGTAHQFSF
jgi:hypothetical protein